MDVEVINKELDLDLYGFSGIAVDKNYSGTAFKLMDRMWKVVKGKNLKNDGENIWVYEPNDKVFAGVQLHTADPSGGLEFKKVHLDKYGYYKHIGPYQTLPQAGREMKLELKNKGFESHLLYIEIYGHWTSDETKLETELIMSLK